MGRKVRISWKSVVVRTILLAGLTLFLTALPVKAQEVAPAASPSAAENLDSFRLSQAVVRPPEITVYLEILTRDGSLAQAVTPDQITAILSDTPLILKDIHPFRSTGEGVAYIILVDISKSLKQKEFEQMRQVLFGWIDAMDEKDRAAVLTFGTNVKRVHDFSADKASLKHVVAILQPVDDYTQLHQGLVDALDLGRRIDKDLPMRRAIITLSDGQDDFAGGVTKQEVFKQLEVDPVPIYAVGFSSPPKTTQKEEALKTLGAFARTSGGAYLMAEKGKFPEIFSRMREKIMEVYAVNLKCETCQWKGQEGRLQMDLRYGPIGMRTGLGIVLLPRERFKGIIVLHEEEDKTPVVKWWEKIPYWGYAGAGLVLLSLIAATILLLQKRERVPIGVLAGGPDAAKDDYPGPEPYQPLVTPTTAPAFPSLGEEMTAQPDRVTATMGAPSAEPRKTGVMGQKIRLTPIRGSEHSKSYEANLVNRLVIGRSKEKCDLVLPDDREVSKTHCELTYKDGLIHIADLGSTNGTFVNGVPITGRYQLQNDDIIGLGKMELRFIMVAS